jgi:uncharacterized protein YbbK (DUF523 family)
MASCMDLFTLANVALNVVLLSSCLEEKMVKFSNRKKVDAKSVSDIREMPMVVVQR